MQMQGRNVGSSSCVISQPHISPPCPWSGKSIKLGLPNLYHSVFTLMVTWLITLLQLKYQTPSPSGTNPAAISLAIVSLFLYCLAYVLMLNAVHVFRSSKYCPKIMGIIVVVFGSMGLASLGSLLFPTPAQLTILTILYALVLVIGLVLGLLVLRERGCSRPAYNHAKRRRRRSYSLPLHTRHHRPTNLHQHHAILYLQFDSYVPILIHPAPHTTRGDLA